MYKGHSLWDQAKEKYDNHATGEITGDYHGKDKYSGNDKYNEHTGGEYGKKEESEERKEPQRSDFEKRVDDNLPHKKYEKKEDQDATLIKAAAQEIRQGIQEEQKKLNKKSNSAKSIEDAIKKAIQDEKEVVRL